MKSKVSQTNYQGSGEMNLSIINLRNFRDMVPPVLKVLSINGLSLVGKESTITGETGEGDDRDGEEYKSTNVAGFSSITKEPVNSWVTWPPHDLGNA